MASFKTLFRVTAFRLSLIYILVFGLLGFGVVTYMTAGTVNVLRKQYESSIDEEVTGLAKIYRQGGIGFLIRTLEKRASGPGANLYVVSDPSGRIIAGNVPELESGVMSRIGWTGKPFRYSRFGDRENSHHRAVARVLEVPNGMRILVGRDIGEHEGYRDVVRRAFIIVLASMVGLGLLTWLFVGKRALRRIDDLSRSSRRILGGDRTERLPVTGAGDEFDRLSENLNQMLDRIFKLDEGLKQMSDNIAHDLKTPITRLRNKAEQALSATDAGKADNSAIEDIITDCDEIVKTFDALLMISRVESGSSVTRFSQLDLMRVLEDVHELYSPVAEDADVEFELGKSPEPEGDFEITGSRELISQAVSNLVDNALKYGKPQKGQQKITLGISAGDQHVTVEVCDNGPGIGAEDRNRAIERFVRLDNSRTETGNGLGLSLVKAIAKLHGGKFGLVDNKPGLCANLTLPRVADQSVEMNSGNEHE